MTLFACRIDFASDKGASNAPELSLSLCNAEESSRLRQGLPPDTAEESAAAEPEQNANAHGIHLNIVTQSPSLLSITRGWSVGERFNIQIASFKG